MISKSAANPFLLMMDPEAVLRAVESSERLRALDRHVCRPLDKPMLGGRASENLEADDEPVRGDAAERFSRPTGFQGLA